MTDFLEQLVDRSAGGNSLAIRPRLPSRFEASDVRDANELVETHVAMPAEPANHGSPENDANPSRTFPRAEPFVQESASRPEAAPTLFQEVRVDDSNSPRQAGDERRVVNTSTIESVPQPDDLSSRLDALESRLKGFAAGADKPRRIRPENPIADKTSESTVVVEQHSHRYIDGDRIENFSEESHQHFHNVPQVAAEPAQRHQPPQPIWVAPPQPTAQKVGPPRGAVPKNVVVNQPGTQSDRATDVTAPLPKPAVDLPRRDRQPPPAPRIVVENSQAKDQPQHTVTVTIGRIEVRPPQQSAPKLEKPKRPAPRIMSLDDYMRRRAGGVG